MLAGPLFTREWLTSPRRPLFTIQRAAYAGVFFLVLWTTWQAIVGFEHVPALGEIARFHGVAFELLSFTQLAILLFAGSLYGAGSVSIEKDRRTFILLLVTRLTDREIVLGKFSAALLQTVTVMATSVPIFMLMALFGGVSFGQIVDVLAATLGGIIISIAIGVLIAVWRDKTFQSLALTIVAVVLSLLLVESLSAALPNRLWMGEPIAWWCRCLSPVRAIEEALRWDATRPRSAHAGQVYLLVSTLLATILLTVAIVRMRAWNPRGEPIQERETDDDDKAHTDPRTRERTVWDWPVFWREVRTRAYGTRAILIKLAYVAIAAVLIAGLLREPPDPSSGGMALTLSWAIAPVAILSLLLVNAQALASITAERDLKSIDLLLVSDVTPREFVYGKIAGVLFNTKELILIPLAILAWIYAQGWADLPGLVYTSVSFLVMVAFATVLGLHAGLRQPTSRSAIAHGLGTMFLLFVGILICLYLVVISGRFEAQWASFVVFIVLGSIGLWISLSANHPSPAITLAASLLPVATFYTILAFVVGDRFAPFAVVCLVYGFALRAMLVPLLAEFDVATGRTSAEGD